MLTNKYHNVLYVGVTADIVVRVADHKSKKNPNSFAAKYNCDKLVYYLSFSFIEEAIAEEKRIKGGSKDYKRSLVTALNPKWEDLYEGLI